MELDLNICGESSRELTDPWGRANSFWFCEGMIVPVDEAEDAEEAEESSSSSCSSVSK
jgi:hypothetical protein